MIDYSDNAARDARTAAQIEAEVGVEHIAEVYAKALIGAARHAGNVADIVDEFDQLVADVFDKFPKFDNLLASALVSESEKSGIIDRTLGGKTSTTMANFLKVLARRQRLDCLRAILLQTHKIYDKMQYRIPVELTTAAPLGDAELSRIADDLRKKIGGEPVIRHRVDPDLIGGAVIRIGDVVHDGSIANQLKLLRKRMSHKVGQVVNLSRKEERQ
ncbi:MAG: ATP synthase F1 subunit delta [Pirellulaceae bacterium]|nr:ATP synthase F1 subunit delta [Pirellulaceae bacterium]